MQKKTKDKLNPWGAFHKLYEKWTVENPQSLRKPTS